MASSGEAASESSLDSSGLASSSSGSSSAQSVLSILEVSTAFRLKIYAPPAGIQKQCLGSQVRA